MRHIEKGEPPESFCAWTMLANDNWSPSFENLQNPEKAALHGALLAEQGGVCCYCGGRIDASRSHIEHFRPQEIYPHLALDYTNLHASCIRETSPGIPLHVSLENRRRAALTGTFEIDLTDDELHAIAISFRSRNSKGLLPEFGHVIASCAERYFQIHSKPRY